MGTIPIYFSDVGGEVMARHYRSLCALGLVLIASSTHAADAKLRCPQLFDRTGDVREFWPYVGIPDDQLDTVSGNIAGNKTTLAVNVGLLALDTQDPMSPNGRQYLVVADVGKGPAATGPFVGFAASFDPLGVTYTAAVFTDPEPGDMKMTWSRAASGKVELAKRQIQMTAPYSAFKGSPVSLAKGVLVRRLWVFGVRGGDTPVALIVDTGRADLRYRLGDPACISIGR